MPFSEIPASYPVGIGQVIIDVTDTDLDFVELGTLPAASNGWSNVGIEHLVLTGALGGAPTNDGIDIELRSFADADDDFVLESFAAIEVRGYGHHGIDLENHDTGHTGTIEARNHRAITTNGDGWAHAIAVTSRSRENGAEAKAVNRGTLKTNGKGAAGILVRFQQRTVGKATAINYGSITTTGGAINKDSFAEGLLADSRGSGSVEATNEGSAAIVKTGTDSVGARGVAAVASNTNGASGAATAKNSGSVTTQGNPYVYDDMGVSKWVSPAGIFARSTDGKATAQNVAGGTVDTHGEAAYGVFARSNNGRAQAENLDTVRTRAAGTATVTLPEGDAPTSALGVFAWSDIGDATAENGAANNDAAAVTTAGPGAIGLMAMNNNDGDTRASTVTANNYGSVTTTGANAEGVVALALHGGSSTDSNTVQALNGVGASISTGGTAGSGDGSGGLSASILVTGGGTAYGSASVENRGTITTTGARSSASALDNAFGISAHYYNTDDVTINNAGDVTAKNIGGEITVSGPGARGIQAITYGSGVATVIADGGTVTASYKDSGSTNAGTGIFASSGGSAGTVDVEILNGATIDAQNAIFIRNAAADIMVSGGSLVIGNVDVPNRRADRMTVDASTVRGRMQFAQGADTLTVRNGGKVEGAIWFGLHQDELIVENGGTFDESVNFGSESDTLRVNSGNARFNGELQFLDVFEGIGGWIQLRDDVIFLGNSDGEEEQGSPGSATFGSADGSTAQVSIYGDFNLGESGTMTIHDGSRVQLVASLDDMGELVLPTIDAGGREDEGVRGITCLDSEGAVTGCTLYVQNDEGGGGAGV